MDYLIQNYRKKKRYDLAQFILLALLPITMEEAFEFAQSLRESAEKLQIKHEHNSAIGLSYMMIDSSL
ncbi:MAG: hypothetical protein ACOC08_03015 [Campylobacterales bacterium]